MSSPARFVEVAVALPLPGTYHYAVPPRFAGRLAIGSRVLVPFGARSVSGVVVRLAAEAPADVRVLDVADALDAEPALPEELVSLCLWIADYYEAPPGEVLRGALPAGTQVAAEQVVEPTDAGRAAAAGQGGALPRRQRELLHAVVAAGRLPRSQLARRAAEVEALRAAGLVAVVEARSAPRVAPRTVRTARLADSVDLAAARVRLARAPKRLAVLDALAAGPVETAQLAASIPGAAAALRELVAAALAAIEVVTVEPVAATAGAEAAASGLAGAAGVTLTAQQRAALDAITGAEGFAAFLLHGVTGSGKTEVYLHAIADTLRRGRTAIVLVPEISLTPQLAARFRARFGDQVAILHSGLSDRDRLGEWQRLRRGTAHIALGARSAIFAPVSDLGIIVIDEEHDGSFKQDEGVRYHGRDVALVRAQRAGAVCVLGSATPSLESFTAAEASRYQLLSMPDRATARPLPSVDIVDLRTYQPDGEAMLSAPLAQAITETLAAGDQVILFLNRRGFATFVLCRACGHAFRCPHCSVSLTYHRAADRLLCHYCGFAQRVPEVCPSCQTRGAIERRGLGTEKVADAIAERFPGARVQRLDRDVATGAKVEALLARMARREIDVLVGTQMVTKGHDFPGVTLVGVLCADTGLSLPDFRASERTFQLLTQVAGRAGRGDRAGRVLIQTYKPDASAVACAAGHDYLAFYRAELAARGELGYPPHGRLVAVRIDGTDEPQVASTAQRLAQLAGLLGRDRGIEVLGPTPAPLSRLRGRHRWQIWLRGKDRGALRQVVRGVGSAEIASNARVSVDVDPVAAL